MVRLRRKLSLRGTMSTSVRILKAFVYCEARTVDEQEALVRACFDMARLGDCRCRAFESCCPRVGLGRIVKFRGVQGSVQRAVCMLPLARSSSTEYSLYSKHLVLSAPHCHSGNTL